MMSSGETGENMQLRPHHVYCLHFLTATDASARGQSFQQALEQRERLFKDQEQGEIQVIAGPDLICQSCPYYDAQGCSHPAGAETEVRKWDRRIVAELDLRFGQAVTVEDMKHLIRNKHPLCFCLTRCPHYQRNECRPEVLPEYLAES